MNKNTPSPAADCDFQGLCPFDMNTIAGFANSMLAEQRRSRRWSVVFRCLLWLYLFGVLAVATLPLATQRLPASERHTAVVQIEGLIAPGMPASADKVITALTRAADNPHVAGIIIDINSPGGTPVQAGQIYQAIQALRTQHPTRPVYAVIGDTGASGGYYVAAAAEKIYAHQASVVGSIGVRAGSFEFTEAMERLGVRYRLYAAGEHKVFLDPFVASDPVAETHFKGVLSEMHQQFIDAVRAGRGDRLGNEPALFSGLVWTGAKAMELGLVDALADVRQVAAEVIGAAKRVDYTEKDSWVEKALTGVESEMGGWLARILARVLPGGLQ